MRLHIDETRQFILLSALDLYVKALGDSKKKREAVGLDTEDEDDRLMIIGRQPDGLKWQLGYREEKPEKKDPAQQDAFADGDGAPAAETGGRAQVGGDLSLKPGSRIQWPSGEYTNVAEIVAEGADVTSEWRVVDEQGNDVYVLLHNGVWLVQDAEGGVATGATGDLTPAAPKMIPAQSSMVGYDPGAGDERETLAMRTEGGDYEILFDSSDDSYSAGANPRAAHELLQALGVDVPLDVVEGWSRDDRAEVERWCIAERNLRLKQNTTELTQTGRAMAPPLLAFIFGDEGETNDTQTLGMDERLRGEQGELGADDESQPSAEALADLE